MDSPARLPPPVVYERVHLVDMMQHVLDQGQYSTFVMCSTKEAFVELLQQDKVNDIDTEGGEPSSSIPTSRDLRSHADRWNIPTLRLLASSRRIRLVFCPDVTHLRAYLSIYSMRQMTQPGGDETQHAIQNGCPLLVIVDPIRVHRPTSAFSAQGLNRTFAVAVEAAARAKSRLILAECEPAIGRELPDESHIDSEESTAEAVPPAHPWDEEVSILNVTTKTFGAGERGWVGRTVKIRSIAERWCRFETIAASKR